MTHVLPALPSLVPLMLQPLQKVHPPPRPFQREVLATLPRRMGPLPAVPLLMVPQLLLRMPLHPPLPSLPLPSYWPFLVKAPTHPPSASEPWYAWLPLPCV
jgi:hypothetical protein